jgi:L-alanine-DL-glutamate epimerase-like enolase superfamily enzyme
MATYDRVKDLPLRVDGYGLEPHARETPHFTRRTTTIHLHGAGETGLGEDVVYAEEDHLHQQEVGPVLELTGDWTLDSFAAHVRGLDLFHGRPSSYDASTDYRQWAFESAALDLALRQAGTSLHAALGREPRPLDFVTSLRLGEPPSLAPLERRPTMRFKLDSSPSWDDDFVRALAATGRVDSVDFKGCYRGTPVDVETDPALYRRVAELLPEAWLEDPDVTVPEARAALEPHADRITWDAPIHSIADVEALEWAPRSVNVKPSRVGSVKGLFDFYDYCDERGIRMYAGGQSELSVGRGQNQLLASLFHPDGPNDIAPGGWDWEAPPPGLPDSPLDPAPEPVGFRRAASI